MMDDTPQHSREYGWYTSHMILKKIEHTVVRYYPGTRPWLDVFPAGYDPRYPDIVDQWLYFKSYPGEKERCTGRFAGKDRPRQPIDAYETYDEAVEELASIARSCIHQAECVISEWKAWLKEVGEDE